METVNVKEREIMREEERKREVQRERKNVDNT